VAVGEVAGTDDALAVLDCDEHAIHMSATTAVTDPMSTA
jgi:hypothetical protein